MNTIFKKHETMTVLVGILVFLTTSCAGNQLNVEKIAKTENPSELIRQLEGDLDQAKSRNIHILSPTWYQKAESSLSAAKQMRDQGEDLENILEKIALGNAQLNQAKEISEVSQTVLPKAIQARNDARAAGAAQFQKDYPRIEQGFLNLTSSIEKNNLDRARKNEEGVVKDFRNIELRAIKENALSPIREMVREAEEMGARKMVPQTFSLAQVKLQEADEFITKNRYQADAINEKANQALFHATRLLQITRETQNIHSKSPEEISLWVEGILTEVAKPLKGGDLRHLRFENQVKNIKGSINDLQSQKETLAEKSQAQQEQLVQKAQLQQTEIELLKDKMASLEGRTLSEQEAKALLEAEKRFNRLYEEVRAYFDSNEAEIFKQGNDLLIRLKTIQFPVGQSVILPKNFSLLTKVQRAILTFGQPQVVIEGHTDTTGTNEINQKLSHDRATAVREYLVANGTVNEDNIDARGFGSIKPIVSNETPEGRAMNRRIDVVIKPSETTQVKNR